MSLEIVTGDVFNVISGKFCIFAHGTNCAGAFGSGVAGIVKKLYPYAYKKYMTEKKADNLRLGNVQLALEDGCDVLVANCLTQESYGRDGKLYVSYDGVIESLQKVATYSRELKLPVYMPMIGGGLGGGDIKRLTAIMQAVFYDVEAYLYIQD